MRLSGHPARPVAKPGSETGQVDNLSLEGMHGSVTVPESRANFWRQLLAFMGPAWLVSVGYMDPGNWGTDLQAGAQFRYHLLWVVALASLMAIFLQIVAARLGVVTGKDLAQCSRDWYPAWMRWPNWLFCELAIAGTDLAESLGSAVAINLLFGIPLLWALVITAFDVVLLLSLRNMGMRLIEAIIGGAGVDHRPLLFHRDLRAAGAPEFPGGRPGLAARLHDDRYAGVGHRHHRRHGDAA